MLSTKPHSRYEKGKDSAKDQSQVHLLISFKLVRIRFDNDDTRHTSTQSIILPMVLGVANIAKCITETTEKRKGLAKVRKKRQNSPIIDKQKLLCKRKTFLPL